MIKSKATKLSKRVQVKSAAASTLVVQSPFRAATKQSLIFELINRPDGASLEELITASGWQAHSVRAVLSGFRKRSLNIKSVRSDDGSRRYRFEHKA
jgi:Protein of unknown function (DUF3489)